MPEPTYSWPSKAPDEALDYGVDWTDVLDSAGSEGISSAAWAVSSPGISTLTDDDLTVDGSKSGIAEDKLSTTVWLVKGLDGRSYRVQCKITTDSTPARIFVRSVRIAVEAP